MSNVVQGIDRLPAPVDVTAALQAGKIPSNAQFVSYVDWALSQPLIAPAGKGQAELSEQGNNVIQAVRDVLEAWKRLAKDKNYDDQLQEFLFHTSSSALKNAQAQRTGDTAVTSETQKEVSDDASQLVGSLRTVAQILLQEVSPKNSSLSETIQYVSRDVAADAAETVEENARKAKENLRQRNEQQAEKAKRRREAGRAPEDERREKTDKEKFRSTMDQIKSTGSTGFDLRDKAVEQQEALKRAGREQFAHRVEEISKRAQQEPEFKTNAHAVLDIIRKYVREKPAAGESDRTKPPRLDDLADSTGHLQPALRSFNTLLTRLTNDPSKSLQHLLDVAWDVSQDLRDSNSEQAKELRQWYDDADAYARRVVDEEGYVTTEEGKQEGERIWDRWNDLSQSVKEGTQSESQQHLERLRQSLHEYKNAIAKDPAVNELTEANIQLAEDLASYLGLQDQGLQGLRGRTQEIASDILGALLSRLFGMVEALRIPRTEFISEDLEFVIDNLSLSGFSILPGLVKWSQTLDLEVSKPSIPVAAQTRGKTHGSLRFKGASFAARDVSFWVKTSESPVKLGGMLKEDSGLADIQLDEHGVEVFVEFKLRESDSTSSQTFYEVTNVKVELHDFNLTVKEDKHKILTTLFKSTIRSKVQQSLESSLAEEVRDAFERLDRIAWDTKQRIDVYRDTPGTNEVSAIIGGVLSELGKLWREPGPLTGLYVTDVGVVKDRSDTDKAFAIGTAPQILPGDKTGPRPAPLAQAGNVGEEVRKNALGGKESVKEQAAIKKQELNDQRQRLQEDIRRKTAEERKKEGWKSGAFDLRKRS